MKKRNFFVMGMLAMLVFGLSSCGSLFNLGVGAALKGIARSQASSAHKKVVAKASAEMLKVLPSGSKVWIHNRATGGETAIAAGIIDDLTSAMLANNRVAVDRESAALIASERNIQLSGNVRDSDIMSIGNQIGAQYLAMVNIIVTNPGGAGVQRRAQLRVLNIETNALLYQSDTHKDWRIR